MATWQEREQWHAKGGGPSPIPGDTLGVDLEEEGWALGEPQTKSLEWFLVIQSKNGKRWLRLYKCLPASLLGENTGLPPDTMVYMDNVGGVPSNQLRGGVVVAHALPSTEAFALAVMALI